MKKILLKILMIDDHTLIKKSKLYGIIYLILAMVLAAFLCLTVHLMQGIAGDVQQTYAEHAPSFENRAIILTDDVSCRMMVRYASHSSSLIGASSVALGWYGVSISCMLVAFGVIHIRYYQIIKKMKPRG